MGDTIWYAGEIKNGQLFHDAGHLLWRPLGWLVWQIYSYFGIPSEVKDLRASIIKTLITINWLAGLMAVYFLYKWIGCISGRSWRLYLITVGFIFSNAFLNYTKTGTPYIIRLSFLLLGLLLLGKSANQQRYTPIYASLTALSFTFSTCMWLPYILVMPGVLFSYLLISVQAKIAC